MVLVGQQKRLAQPVAPSRRERVAIKVFAALMIVAAAAAVAVYATRGSPGSHCVSVTFASFTGGVTAQQCGAKAAAWCRSADAAGPADKLAAAVRVQCRRAGYGPAPGSPAAAP